MCIIAIKPADKAMFDESTIKTMFSNNPHGAGIMFVKPDGTVHIEKGFFKVDDMLKYISDNEKTLDKADCVLHFRIATSGKKDALGCHPYPVWQNNKSASDDTSLAMCHNGILDRCGYHGNSEINDTQVFIKDCLRKLPHNFLKNKAITKLIGDSIDTNKLAFLDKNGIHTIGKFTEDEGYYFSNDSYKPRIPYWDYPQPYFRRSCVDDLPKTEDDLYEAIELFPVEKVEKKSPKVKRVKKDKSMFNKILSKEQFTLLTKTIKGSCKKASYELTSYLVVHDECIWDYIDEKKMPIKTMVTYALKNNSYVDEDTIYVLDKYNKVVWRLSKPSKFCH